MVISDAHADQALEDAWRLAQAEDALAALGIPEAANAWSGAGKRWKTLDEARTDALRRVRGEQLLVALGDYAKLTAEVDERARAAAVASECLQVHEASPAIRRWRAAHGMANALSVGQPFAAYAAWIASGPQPAGQPRRADQYPDEKWPATLIFSEEDAADIRAWRAATGAAELAHTQRVGSESQLAELLRRHPELAAVPVERLPALLSEIELATAPQKEPR